MRFTMTGTKDELERKIEDHKKRGFVPVSELKRNVSYGRRVFKRNKKYRTEIGYEEKYAVMMSNEKQMV